MSRAFPRTALAAFVLVLLPAVAGAQTQISGQTDSGAFYRIAVPDGWTPFDGLVIWNHGFSLSPVGPLDEGDLGPLVAVQLAEGYAVAASSYSQSGWALFQTDLDNRQLVEVFEAEFGVPSHVLVYGASLGGLVTAQAIEQGDLGNVVGALPVCGALAGSRTWDGGLDLRLLYDFVCADIPGAAIPGGAEGLPVPPPAGFDTNALAAAVNACTGVLLEPTLRTPEQQERLDFLLDITGLPEEFLLTDMGFVTFALSDLVHDPAKLDGASAIGNLDVDYGDPAVNAGIERVAADPAARTHLFQNYTPSGDVGAVKIVSLHTDKDGLVIVEHESDYASKVPPANLTVGIVVEAEPSHCGFTPAELLAGWEALRGWVAGLPQPTAADLQDVCETIAGGLAPGSCRIDPGFDVPPFTERVRPRAVCEPDADTLCLNDGRFAVELDWTTEAGLTGPGRDAGPKSDDSGLFYFFDRDNWEVLVKVLDGCDITGHYWVFHAGTTDVAFELRVTDNVTGAEASYLNPQKHPADAITDTSAFATCP
jgi:hypothetical protein